MQDFSYHVPSTVDEAIAILRDAEAPRLLAGGQTLLPRMKLEQESPSDLVSVASVLPRGIQQIDDTVEIGAGATHYEIANSHDVVQVAVPALAGLAAGVGDVQVRYRGTLGGALALNDPAGEYPAAALALDAVVRTDRREIRIRDFFAGTQRTVLEQSEIILAVRFAIPSAAAYRKILDPAARWPMVGVFVAHLSEQWRVAVTGAHVDGAFRHSAMETALAMSLAPEEIAKVETDFTEFRDTPFGDPRYRANLVNVLARRCLEALAEA